MDFLLQITQLHALFHQRVIPTLVLSWVELKQEPECEKDGLQNKVLKVFLLGALKWLALHV